MATDEAKSDVYSDSENSHTLPVVKGSTDHSKEISTTFLLESAFNPKVKLERIPIPATPPDTESESETVKTDCGESLSPNDESSRSDSPVRTQSKARQRLSSLSDSDIELIDAGNCTEDDEDTEPVPDTSNENNPDLRSISRPSKRKSRLNGDNNCQNESDGSSDSTSNEKCSSLAPREFSGADESGPSTRHKSNRNSRRSTRLKQKVQPDRNVKKSFSQLKLSRHDHKLHTKSDLINSTDREIIVKVADCKKWVEIDTLLENATEKDLDHEVMEKFDRSPERRHKLENKLKGCVSIDSLGPKSGRWGPLCLRVISDLCDANGKQSVWVEDCSVNGKGQAIMFTRKNGYPDFEDKFSITSTGNNSAAFLIKNYTVVPCQTSEAACIEIRLDYSSKVSRTKDVETLRCIGWFPFSPAEDTEQISVGDFIDIKAKVTSVKPKNDAVHIVDAKTQDFVLWAAGRHGMRFKILCDDVDKQYCDIESINGKIVKIRSARVIAALDHTLSVSKPFDAIEEFESPEISEEISSDTGSADNSEDSSDDTTSSNNSITSDIEEDETSCSSSSESVSEQRKCSGRVINSVKSSRSNSPILSPPGKRKLGHISSSDSDVEVLSTKESLSDDDQVLPGPSRLTSRRRSSRIPDKKAEKERKIKDMKAVHEMRLKRRKKIREMASSGSENEIVDDPDINLHSKMEDESSDDFASEVSDEVDINKEIDHALDTDAHHQEVQLSNKQKAKLERILQESGSIHQLDPNDPNFLIKPLCVRVISEPWTTNNKQSVWVEDFSHDGQGQAIMFTWGKDSFPNFSETFSQGSSKVYQIELPIPEEYKASRVSQIQIRLSHLSEAVCIGNTAELRDIGCAPSFQPVENLKEIEGKDFVDLKIKVTRVEGGQWHREFDARDFFLFAKGKNGLAIRINCNFVPSHSHSKIFSLNGSIVKIRSAKVIARVINKGQTTVILNKPFYGVEEYQRFSND